MQPSSGPITTSGCASPDLVEGLFQTRQPTQYCEWRNGVIGRDAVCYCGTNECNAKEMLENWIQNGGGCKLVYFLLYLETRKSIKDHKACDEELTTYLSALVYQNFGLSAKKESFQLSAFGFGCRN